MWHVLKTVPHHVAGFPLSLNKMILAAYEKKPGLSGDVRKFRVWLDENQYRLDTETQQEDAIDVR